jgi:two-component system LytT family response regulator
MQQYKTIIIDDEKPARDLIKNFLLEYDQIKIIGEADNGFEGCRIINREKPDLVFLDIQMPRLSGIELLDLIELPGPFIIFSTAYDEYAVQAFEKNAVDYLLKPYNRDRFHQAMDKFFSRPPNKPGLNFAEKLRITASPQKKLERIPVRTGTRIQIIKIEDIRIIAAEDDYVNIVSRQGKFLKQLTMSYLERFLPDTLFVRIHRSYIINIQYLKQLEIYDKQGYMAILDDNSRVPVSRSGNKKLRRLIDLDGSC